MPTPSHLRLSAQERGYTWAWHKARTRYLQHHPLCAMCAKAGHIVAANVVDHITPHRGNHLLFWDERNWQPLCRPCHDRSKKQIEQGRGGPQHLDANGWPIVEVRR
jgi:5-methylcytosine-specific restriction protein A